MKIFLTTVLLVMVIMLGFTGISEAQDCRDLIGTWNIDAVVTWTKINGTVNVGDSDSTVYDFTKVENEEAKGHEFYDYAESWDIGDGIQGVWNPTLGKFVISWPFSESSWEHNGEELPYVDVYGYVSVDGDQMWGELDCTYCKARLVGTRVPGTEWTLTCSKDQPSFDMNTYILSLPALCIDGKIYENISVILNADGTWGIAE